MIKKREKILERRDKRNTIRKKIEKKKSEERKETRKKRDKERIVRPLDWKFRARLEVGPNSARQLKNIMRQKRIVRI
jgi:hypothetical protein